MGKAMGNVKIEVGIAIVALCLSPLGLGPFQPIAAMASQQSQHSKIDSELQRLTTKKQQQEQRAGEIRCHLGKPAPGDDCASLLASAPTKTQGGSLDCSSFPTNSLKREQCEIRKQIEEIRQSLAQQDNKANSNTLSTLSELQKQEARINAEIGGLEKELAEIAKLLKETEKEIAYLEKQKGKSEELLQAEENYKLAREEYREAARNLPKNATPEERKKLLGAQEKKTAAAARELYKAKSRELAEQKTKAEGSYEKCISTISTFDPSNPGSTDLAAACSGVGPADADYALAMENTDKGKAERKRIKDYANEQKEKELAALKEEEKAAYAEMMTYADTSKECGASQQAGNSWACETAAKTSEYGTLVVAAAQQVGNVSLQIRGGQNMQRMNPQSGFSEMYETAAKNADAVAETNHVLKYTVGAIGAAQTGAGLTALITNMASSDLQQEAAEEHRTQGLRAIMSGIASGALAYQHHLQEEMARNEARALRQIRDGYRGIEDLQIGKNPDPLENRGSESPFQNPFSDADSKQGASGDFSNPEKYPIAKNVDTPPPSLGEPINVSGGGGGNKNAGGAPAPLPMVAGTPSGGSGGGLGYFAGGGSSGSGQGFSPSSADDEASGNAHQYAGMMNNPSKYSSGGSGGGSKGGGTPGGVDLSSMLAKFLPGFGDKKEEKEQKRGILSFGKKNNDRTLAGHSDRGGNPYDQDLSTIDRTRSLFDRVHMAYQLKQKENAL